MEEEALFDFGNIKIPSLDLPEFDTVKFGFEKTRYMPPKENHVKERYIKYDNAVKLAKELRLEKNERAYVIVGGNFIFGDFLEAYCTTHIAHCKKMTITTLSLSQENVDSLRNLIEYGLIDELNLIVSLYFYAYERRGLIPYIYKELDVNNIFQLAVAGIHTKITQFETAGGRKIVIHGSANLRSSANVEQFAIEENPAMYDFNEEMFAGIIDRYKTINKPIPRREIWDTITSTKKQNTDDKIDRKQRGTETEARLRGARSPRHGAATFPNG